MLRRMLFVALFLGVPSAFANGIAVSPSAGAAASSAAGLASANLQARMAARAGSNHMFKALLFAKSAKMARPAEEGEITF